MTMKINTKRIKELENKARCNCWEYCYEQGLTKEEQKEYDSLVYEID